jgi:hypothetical protein
MRPQFFTYDPNRISANLNGSKQEKSFRIAGKKVEAVTKKTVKKCISCKFYRPATKKKVGKKSNKDEEAGVVKKHAHR